MQPIKLKMNAFGPYASEEVIDFTELKNNKLFLISGPTGSGKTTIFDAMSYVLYGEANGEYRTTDDLRSQFAGPDTLTWVSLEFSVKGVAYKILREPSQLREKKVGDGLTTHNAYAELIIYNQEPAQVITGVQDVTSKIIDIIGLDAEQFKQIMMIPQGEFRKLLISDSQDREKILQKLFDTRIYKSFQEALKSQERTLKNKWDTLKSSQNEAINRINNERSNENLEKILSRESIDIDQLITSLKALNQSDEEKINIINESIKRLDNQLTLLIEKKTKGIELNKQIDSFKKVKKQLEIIKQEESSITELKKALNQAKIAKDIKPYKEALDKIKNEITKKNLDLEKNEIRYEKLMESFKETKKNYEFYQSEVEKNNREKLKEQLMDYRRFLEKMKSLKTVEEDITKSEKALENKKIINIENNNEIGQIKEKINLAQKKIEKLENTLDLNTINEELQVLNAKKILLDQMIGLKADINVLKHKASDLNKRLSNQNEKMLKSEHKYKKAKLLFHKNQAALLAKSLNENEPCPVCGALEHPNKAEFIEDIITSEQLDSLEKAYNEETIAYETLRKECLEIPDRIDQIVKKVDQLKEELKSYDNNTELTNIEEVIRTNEELIKVFSSKKEKANNNRKEINVLKNKIQDLSSSLENKLEMKNTIEREMKTIEHALATFISKKDTVKEEIPSDLQSEEKITIAVSRLEEEIEERNHKLNSLITKYNDEKVEIEKLKSVIQVTKNDLETLKNEAITSNEEFINELSANNMTAAVFTDSISKIEKIDYYKKKIDAYILEKNKLENEYNRLDQVIGEASPVTIALIQEEINDLGEKKDAILLERERYASRLSTNKRELTKILEIKEEIKSVESEYLVLGELADVANGKNEHRMTFERYILAAFLEDIIYAANIRLNKMTSGRYEMFRTEKKERANKQSGLEIEVFDNYTGKKRHVKTLSGGESFMASLAMALGLSDIVQSYAGNVRLDTMFVDEGFGTLDPDALDAAINCLIDLQDSGRLVGLISHVPELKERIEARLEVSTTNIGSTTKFIVL